MNNIKKNPIQKFLVIVERLGNVLPHPVTLFAILCVMVLCISQMAEWLDLSVVDPRPEGAKNRASDGLITAIGLLNAEGIRKLFVNLVKNYTNFAPLGTVLVTMLAVGVAEYSGMLTAFIRGLVLKAPDRLITFAVVFAGILSNTASELGYVVLIPLGGYVFISKGRHPLAGMAAAFAGVSGGYSANLFIGTVDPLLSGITQEAARLIAPEYTTHAAINWYFMMISTVLISVIGTYVTERIVEPNLGEYEPGHSQNMDQSNAMAPLTGLEKKGLKFAGLAVFMIAMVAAFTIIPESGILRDPVTGNALKSPFMKGIVTWIFIFFLIPSIVYGKVVGSIKNDKDVIDGMTKAMSTMGLYMVLVFFAAQFIAFFKWSNLGTILAVSGANLMQSMEMTGPAIFIPFILLCGFVNLMLGSASAQWAVTAPIFVPMLMLVGYSPELIQAAYRIGDSTTNIITPMMSYFGLILAFAENFDKRIKIGTIISTMLPYSILFLITWTILFYVWVFLLGMPVGPDAPTFYMIK
ncbi:MAG: aminobenzoyl-glutamate transport protein [Bacteriovoracaceae bacterium]|jgi:aminobenzoyl-glutamate transport protein